MNIEKLKFRNNHLGEIPPGEYIVDDTLVVTPDFSDAKGMPEGRLNDNWCTGLEIGVGQVIQIRNGGANGNINITCGGVNIFCSPNIAVSLSEV